MFDAIRQAITFLVGVLIVVSGILKECPHVAAIIVGLLLMGIFTVPEAIGFVKGKLGEEDE